MNRNINSDNTDNKSIDSMKLKLKSTNYHFLGAAMDCGSIPPVPEIKMIVSFSAL